MVRCHLWLQSLPDQLTFYQFITLRLALEKGNKADYLSSNLIRARTKP